MPDPSYRRLDVDERRRQLLERGGELFTSNRYDELSMSRIAAEVGSIEIPAVSLFPEQAGLLRGDARRLGRGAAGANRARP